MNSLRGRGKVRKQTAAAIRASADTLEASTPPRPWLSWRDVQHVGVMSSGLCIRCFGFADDVRHGGANLCTARVSFDVLRSVFRGVV